MLGNVPCVAHVIDSCVYQSEVIRKTRYITIWKSSAALTLAGIAWDWSRAPMNKVHGNCIDPYAASTVDARRIFAKASVIIHGPQTTMRVCLAVDCNNPHNAHGISSWFPGNDNGISVVTIQALIYASNCIFGSTWPHRNLNSLTETQASHTRSGIKLPSEVSTLAATVIAQIVNAAFW